MVKITEIDEEEVDRAQMSQELKPHSNVRWTFVNKDDLSELDDEVDVGDDEKGSQEVSHSNIKWTFVKKGDKEEKTDKDDAWKEFAHSLRLEVGQQVVEVRSIHIQKVLLIDGYLGPVISHTCVRRVCG